MLGLDQMTPHAASGRSRRLIEEIKTKLGVDQKIARLTDYQRDVDPTSSHCRLELAVRRWRYGAPNMAIVDACFNMPQFYDGNQSEALVYQSGFVEFEFSGSIGSGPSRQRTQSFGGSFAGEGEPRILMAANLSKFQDLRFGKMLVDSPEAKYFHSFGGLRVPLHVLGTLSREKGLFRIKPLALRQYDPEKSHRMIPESRQEPGRVPGQNPSSPDHSCMIVYRTSILHPAKSKSPAPHEGAGHSQGERRSLVSL